MADDGLFCHACKAASPVDAGFAASEDSLICDACGSDFVERMPLRTAERRAARAARAEAGRGRGGGGGADRGGLHAVGPGVFVQAGLGGPGAALPADALMDMLEMMMGMGLGRGGGGR